MSPTDTGPAPSPLVDPTTPGNTPPPTALKAAAVSAIAGTPAAITTVWLLETYGTAHGQPIKLDGETAAAIGAFGAGVLGYIIHVLQGVWDLIQERFSRPPDKTPG